MHDTAYKIGEAFLTAYGSLSSPQIVVEIGSYDVNGSLRTCALATMIYLGLDMSPGPSVDIVVDPTEPLPLRNDFADIVLSSSQMEHDPFFWNTFAEMARITKPGGVIYTSAPSNGSYHRYPSDHWRFYPDCAHALVAWATKVGYPIELVESFTASRIGDMWNDFVAIYRKPPWPLEPIAFLSEKFPCRNVWRSGLTEVVEEDNCTEDMSIIRDRADEIAQLRAEFTAVQEANLCSKATTFADKVELEALKLALVKAKVKIDELERELATGRKQGPNLPNTAATSTAQAPAFDEFTSYKVVVLRKKLS